MLISLVNSYYCSLQLVKKAYEGERLNVEDVTAYSRKIYTENRNDSIYSHRNKYTIGADFKECCNFQDIVLNSKCQAKVSKTLKPSASSNCLQRKNFLVCISFNSNFARYGFYYQEAIETLEKVRERKC